MCTADQISFANVIVTGIGILINGWLAYSVYNLQKKLNNARILKDHFIGEAKVIREEYASFFKKLFNGQLAPRFIIQWFQLMDIKVGDLMSNIHIIYDLDPNVLVPYQQTLNNIVTSSSEFAANYAANSPIVFSNASKGSFVRFQQNNAKVFTDIIVNINNAK